MQSLLRDLAFVGMIGVAQSLLLLVGELDLSVGKVGSLCGILSGMMMVDYNSINIAPGLCLFYHKQYKYKYNNTENEWNWNWPPVSFS